MKLMSFNIKRLLF